MRQPDTFDRDFYRYRFDHPYFGYVKVENDSCAPFYMLTNNDDLVAQHYFWYGKNGYERASVREWIRMSRQASVVFDVGAHTGLFSLLACRCNLSTNAVVAFEPTSRASARIYENLIANALVERVAVETLAISDSDGAVSLMHYEDHYQIGTGASFVGLENDGRTKRTEECRTTSIDAYAARRGLVPDLVKIDIEGAETHALRGARDLLARRSASFLIEVIPSTIDAVVGHLDGYDVFLVEDGDNAVRRYDGGPIAHYTNLVAHPRR
ncbi:FkbM family methyltransferase [Methylobacterium oryzihabitans]|uniref:FkbM family methyltransferase n=1 Tax=Methylobacterium oryzihabitans TaxID=2499852 RepID=A0A3S2YM78_9HYPH|nr:FkbM family methyltransferase [Methylobacterium oryzihabitans]RVU14313.1 FkbM family methyltransferase [Methylobacterium oryzihabitans]